MARNFSLEDVLATSDISMLDEDDRSEDEFDGYLDEEGGDEGGEGEGEDGGEEEGEGEGRDDGEGGEGSMEDDSWSIPQYTLVPGCTRDTTNLSPLDFFTMMMSEEMMEHIVTQTVLYAQQYLESATLRPLSRVHQWNKADFTKADLKKFISIVVTMGVVSYPSLEHHWNTSWPFASFTCSRVVEKERYICSCVISTFR